MLAVSMCNVFQESRACTYSSTVDTNLHATTGCKTIRAGCSDAKRTKKVRERKRNTRTVERKPWGEKKVTVVGRGRGGEG